MKKLGATGRFPRGQLTRADEGELQFAIASDPRTGKVIIDFGKPVHWLGMDAADAERLAAKLLEHAAKAKGV